MPLVKDRAGLQWPQCLRDLSKRSRRLGRVVSCPLPRPPVPPSILQLMPEPTELQCDLVWHRRGCPMDGQAPKAGADG